MDSAPAPPFHVSGLNKAGLKATPPGGLGEEEAPTLGSPILPHQTG